MSLQLLTSPNTGVGQRDGIELETYRRGVVSFFKATTGEFSIPTAHGNSGFDICISHNGGRITVDFGGLVCDFDRQADALPLIKLAASGDDQLRTVYAGAKPIKWAFKPVVAGTDAASLIGGDVYLLGLFKPKTSTVKRNAPAAHAGSGAKYQRACARSIVD
jgi:hypothetical protein